MTGGTWPRKLGGHKSKPPVKVRASSVRVLRSAVRDAMSAELEGAIRGALHRVFRHRDEELIPDFGDES